MGGVDARGLVTFITRPPSSPVSIILCGCCNRSFLLPRWPGRSGEAVGSWLLVLIPDCSLTAETHDCYLRLGRSWVLPGMLLCVREKAVFCIMGISRESSPLIRAGSQRFSVLFFSFPRQLDTPAHPCRSVSIPRAAFSSSQSSNLFPSTQMNGHLCTKLPTSPLTPHPTPFHTPGQAILRAPGPTVILPDKPPAPRKMAPKHN